MKTIKQVYHINAPAQKVWKALVDPKIIDLWGGGPPKMSANVGSSFSLWGGDIHGKNLEVVENKKLIQEWFSGGWKKPSKVSFALKEEGAKTTVELLHEDVPDNEETDISEGWDIYYLGEIKKLLEKKIDQRK
jgi:activator of HSP90 ATPase